MRTGSREKEAAYPLAFRPLIAFEATALVLKRGRTDHTPSTRSVVGSRPLEV